MPQENLAIQNNPNQTLNQPQLQNDPTQIQFLIEDTTGTKYKFTSHPDTKLAFIVKEFFRAMKWDTVDANGQRKKKIIELVDPDNSDRTQRLRSSFTIREAGLTNGSLLRISPEARVGSPAPAIDPEIRLQRLIEEHNNMIELSKWNNQISFETNTDHAPTKYNITYKCKGFKDLLADDTPVISNEHKVEISLLSQYPTVAPVVFWITPVFHPNIWPDSGRVCLGKLDKEYMPGIGLVRIVTRLLEMLQYRDFEIFNPANKRAAMWVADYKKSSRFIKEIAGYSYNGPIEDFIALCKEDLENENLPHIEFEKVKKAKKR